MNKQEAIEICNKWIDHFIDIYPKDINQSGLIWKNEIPDNVRVTVYFEDQTSNGFIINVITSDLTLIQNYIKKWIIQSELNNFSGFKFNTYL